MAQATQRVRQAAVHVGEATLHASSIPTVLQVLVRVSRGSRWMISSSTKTACASLRFHSVS